MDINFEKKILRLLVAATAGFNLFSCSAVNISHPVAVKGIADLSYIRLSPPGTFDQQKNTVFVGDAGNGRKGVDFNFTLNLSDTAFITKASSNGLTQGLASNINKVRIFLTTANGTSASPLANITSLDVTFTPTAGTISTGSRVYTITNLNTAGTYYVGVQLFNNTDNLMKNVSYAVGGSLPVAVSSAVTVNTSATPGVIAVTPVGGVSFTAALRDAVGAQIDAAVTATNGNAALGAITAI